MVIRERAIDRVEDILIGHEQELSGILPGWAWSDRRAIASEICDSLGIFETSAPAHAEPLVARARRICQSWALAIGAIIAL